MRRTKKDAAETRECILDAAEQVFFEQGVARSSLDQIARAGAVTRGAIYWHFRNKADLFNAVVERVRMPMENTLLHILETSDTLDGLQAHCITALLELEQDERLRRVYTVLLLKCEHTDEMTEMLSRQLAIRQRIIEALTDFFRRLGSRGQVRRTSRPRVLAMAVYAYMVGLHIDYLGSPRSFEMPDDAIALVESFFEPLRADGPPAGQEAGE